MQEPRRRRALRAISLALILMMMGAIRATAKADPIMIPGYTVTDLGSGAPRFRPMRMETDF